MGFFNECAYVVRKSNKDMLLIKSENGLSYKYFKNSDLLTHSEKITLIPIDFSNYYFDIDLNDSVYGIFADSKINILKLNSDSNKFLTIHTIDYDYENYTITFPYIKFINNKIHIFYYLTNKNCATSILFHHYNNGQQWFENKVDFINLPVLDSFTIHFNEKIPTIFYLKEANEFPQVFCSIFNLDSLSWNEPIQITNSLENKIYLSILKDKLNFYHISYCESNNFKYSVKYLNGYLKNNSFEEQINKFITDESLYLYPSLLKYNSSIFISYVYKNALYTTYSDDLGCNWSDFYEDEFSINDKFIRAYFKSNYSSDKDYIPTNIFISKDPFGILGNFYN
ncbi:hypothetical protein LZ906_003300 [Paraclostridium ghonii]|uniref:hypothetical protein n=1 Tax=Paraclostridium ghonii TaxID=29358 RepID=UPI00202CC2A1|nr:hypothetical protein [Paeniclostridium ghonii]MCM0165598.1 hypothetical protein [Paeniclostridium ghonii]